MKGFFLEVVNNQIVSSGWIVGPAGDGFWALRILPPASDVPPTTRIVPVQNMQTLNIFDSPEDAKVYAEKVLGVDTSVPVTEAESTEDDAEA